MRKVDDGEEKKKKRKKKIMMFIVATNVIASRPPESRPTGSPHARAKSGLGEIQNAFWIEMNTRTKDWAV